MLLPFHFIPENASVARQLQSFRNFERDAQSAASSEPRVGSGQRVHYHGEKLNELSFQTVVAFIGCSRVIITGAWRDIIRRCKTRKSW